MGPGTGIPVFRASSIGAPRASELAAYGMTGVGAIFAKFHSGEWLDDDEVAVAHASGEHGCRAASEAMAKIRLTLELAGREGVISTSEHNRYIALGKALHYPERTYAALLEASPHPEFAQWLRTNRVDQKRLDPLELVAAIQFAEPEQPNFTLELSVFWERMPQDLERTSLGEADRRVLARAGNHEPTRAAALGWWLARRELVSGAELMDSIVDFCARHGPRDSAAVQAWLTANQWTDADLHALLETNTPAVQAEPSAAAVLDTVIPQYLRSTGECSQLRE